MLCLSTLCFGATGSFVSDLLIFISPCFQWKPMMYFFMSVLPIMQTEGMFCSLFIFYSFVLLGL